MERYLNNDEEWKTIPEFPNYEVSNLGRIWNKRRDREVIPNVNNWGYLKVSFTPRRLTRTVAVLVAEAFVEPYDAVSDCVMILDGDFMNVCADNLVWRPRQFAWRYARQFKMRAPLHYQNLHVLNTDLHIEYESIIQAGIAEGVLFEDIWQSTYLGRRPYPFHYRYKIVESEEYS